MTAGDVADHIDHVREVAGIDAIGVGGDYDGVPTMGEELADVSTYPLVFEELRARGYTDAELRAIAGRERAARDGAAAEVAGRLGSAAARRSRRSKPSTARLPSSVVMNRAATPRTAPHLREHHLVALFAERGHHAVEVALPDRRPA